MESVVPDTISVAVRIRPLINTEKARGCVDILQVYSNVNQIYITTCDKSFTFNHTFGQKTEHNQFYNKCIYPIIGNLFKGYNCTILAYGQTGSGKTHTMGTTYSVGEEEMGVIPRAVQDLYKFINDNFSFDFAIKVSFMELYKEVLYDLLNDKERSDSTLDIREDATGSIVIPNLTEIPVTSASDILKLLSKGSTGRATGKTNMNAQSSRSHAIFTISIAMTDKKNPSICKTSKFHLVDLAGSERASKTGATGETFDEGVNINKGLLALGNVISALGEDRQKALGFIPYRNSSLTRLLKDSLGGNSITIMIACVSPADYNMDETLSTLRYADRARKIKNKPVVNQDPHVAELNRMQKLIDQLQLELAGQGGPSLSSRDIEQLKEGKKQLQAKVGKLSCQLSNVISRSTMLQEHLLLVQTANEGMRDKFKNVYNITLTEMSDHIEACNIDGIRNEFAKLKNLQRHINEIDTEQNKAETEIQFQDELLTTSHTQIDGDTLGELEQQQQHAANQIHLHEELEVVMKQLAHKESLARKVAQSAGITVDILAKAEDEAKIAALETERDQLVVQLDKAKSAKINGIPAEQRKRIQELELRISDLKKRVQEQSRRLSIKKRDEERIVQLNDEIRLMKQTKIQLIRNMKTEAENFRKEKLRREQEMTKLRDQDRKRQNQIVRMESLHNRQTNVLKRQMEGAAAVNKRLKASLALRQNVHEQKSSTGKMDRLARWLKNELDVMINSTQARSTLTSLMESRALLQKHFDNMDKSANEHIIKQFEEDINLRSLQIRDMQQKLIDSDDFKTKINWEYIQTMAEAKHAIKVLFETIPDVIKDLLQKVHEANVDSNNSEFEAKICDLEEEIARLNKKLQCYVNKAMQVTENMKPRLNSTVTLNANPLFPHTDDKHEFYSPIENNTGGIAEHEFHTPIVNNTGAIAKVKIENNTSVFKVPLIVFNSPDIFTDDELADPDWRNTPLAKRISRLQRITCPGPVVKKRSNQGGCTCKNSCSARCGCIRSSSSCNAGCKCIGSCANRLKENDEFSQNVLNAESDDECDDKFDNHISSRIGKRRKYLPIQDN